MLSRRTVVKGLAFVPLAAGASALVSNTAVAQDYPAKTIRMVLGYPAGGAADIVARLIGSQLSTLVGQPVIVDNRPGASGTLAAGQTARADPNGYTLYLGSAAEFSVAPSAMQGRLSYDPDADFVPLAMLVRIPLMLVVHPKLNVDSVDQLIRLAKARPGELNYASFGNGSTPHIAAETFKLTTGTSIEHIAYKGAAPAMTDVLAGRVPIVFDTVASANKYVMTGALRALAVTSDTRVALVPTVPTMVEAGVPGFRSESWIALFAVARTPEPIVRKLSDAIRKILVTPQVVHDLEGMGFIVDAADSAHARTFIRGEASRMSKLILDTGIKFE